MLQWLKTLLGFLWPTWVAITTPPSSPRQNTTTLHPSPDRYGVSLRREQLDQHTAAPGTSGEQGLGDSSTDDTTRPKTGEKNGISRNDAAGTEPQQAQTEFEWRLPFIASPFQAVDGYIIPIASHVGPRPSSHGTLPKPTFQGTSSSQERRRLCTIRV